MKRTCLWAVLLLMWSAGLARAQTSVITTDESELRSAVLGGGIITLNVGTSEIKLTQPIIIQTDTTLTSTGRVAISGGNATRLFVVNPGVRFTVRNLGLFSGRHTATNLNDGGIPDTAGAAIYNNGGTVILLDSTLSSHSVVGVRGSNGADGNTGRNADSGGDAAGAAVYNKAGFVTVSNCTFSANNATGGPGGKGGNGITGVISNGGDGGRGGAGGGAAIYSQAGTLLLYNSTFTNNVVAGAVGGAAGTGSSLGFSGKVGDSGAAVGAAVAADAAYVILSGCTFSANSATGAAGNAGNPGLRNLEGEKGKNGGDAAGGAFYNRGALLATNCTFSANKVTGGQGGSGGAGSNSGFGSNGGDGGDGGIGSGGAIFSNYKVTLINCTLYGNSAVGGEPGGGGAAGGLLGGAGNAGNKGPVYGGAIDNEGVDFSIANTILGNSTGGNYQGTVTDLGGNLSTDATTAFTTGTSRVNINPLLNPLADNGGPTLTMSLTTNSPAIDAGVNSYRPLTDQRGKPRSGPADIGAFELYITPVLPILPDQTVTELATLTLTNTAQVDVPRGTLTYALLKAPGGMTISPSGVISWTPLEVQGPSNYVVVTLVSDNGNPPLTASNTFNVSVLETNSAPVLPAIPATQTISEMSRLTVINTATDSDLPPNKLTYTLVSGPDGAAISMNGVITWTPTEDQGPGTYLFTTVVTDNGNPPLSANNTFTVVVTETNSPPNLPVITPQVINAAKSLTIVNSALDSDSPTNTLTYRLVNAPAGLAISTNGIITWTPTQAQSGTNYLVTTVVSDNGSPALSATNSFVVTVNDQNAPPTVPIFISLSGTNQVFLQWSPAANFVVQAKTTVNGTDWATLSNLPLVSTRGGNVGVYLPLDTNVLSQFFRLSPP